MAQPTVVPYTQRVPPPPTLTEHGSKRVRGHRMKVLHPVKCFPKAQPRFDLCCYKAMGCSVYSPFTYRTLKPIFHCDAKYLASGFGVGQCPQRQNFALGIPTCWYLGANANTLICVLPDAKPKICVLPDAKPKRKPVEYTLRWVPTQNSGVGHVHFMFFCLDFIWVG